MSSLTTAEKKKLEKLFSMGSGYVLDFSDREFADFFMDDFSIDINCEKYKTHGISKAKRLRSFWQQEDDLEVGKVLKQLLLMSGDKNSELYSECESLINRLLKIDNKLLDK